MYVVPSPDNPRGYSLTPSKTEPYATCRPEPPDTAICLSIRPPEGAPLNYPGEGIEGSGWAPSDLRDAYNIPETGGAGQTVAIVIAYHYGEAEKDLKEYRKEYKLPFCTEENGCLEIVNQNGEKGNPPAESAGWAEETSLDLDMASALCPECHIRLVEANSANATNLSAAVDTAAKLTGTVGATTAISASWTVNGSGEFSEETSYDTHYNHPGIPITVAAGDVAYHTYYPAVSPYVVSVGGTVLSEAESSRGWKESVWLPSGGGCSQYEPKPTWQTDWGCAKRMDNDVAADAQLGVSIYHKGKFRSSGGTSASAPIVAGVLAHASKAVREQQAEAFYKHDFFDVTLGRNGMCGNTYLCTAEEGYDGPTGWGTPNGPLEVSASFHVVTEEATAATETGGTLNGYVNPEGSETTYHFEYGQTTAYGHRAPAVDEKAGSGVNWKAVAQNLSGLEKDQTYHYRLVATRGGETSYGPDHRFATIPWAIKTLPKPSETTETTYNSYLFGVSCSSSTACTGVGWYTNKSNAQVGLAHRWNGTEWSLQSMATPEGGKVLNPQGVSCASSTSCIAVGSYSKESKTVTLAESWNGTSWTIQTTQNPEGSKGTELLSVSCTSSTSCTAVGRYVVKEELFTKVYAPLVERWNGSSWSIQATPAPEGATYTELKSVSCTSAEACTAVGKLTNSSGKSAVLRWDGKEWTSQELSTTLTITGVSCTSAEACTAVGGALTALRWNGKEWSVQSMPSPVASYESGQPGSSTVIGVSCSSANQCIAVGKLEREGEKTTMADVWNGVEWAVQGAARPKDGVLNAVSCPADTACASVGSQYAYNAEEGPGYTHWMPLAENANLPASGKPVVETTAATKVSGTTLQLNGTVNPEGLETKYYFEYGLEKGKYEYKTTETSAGFYRSKLEEGQAISGLKPGTTYHFRIVASNAGGTATGEDVAVTTTVWSLQSVPSASGAKWTVLRRVSCISSTECIAVGDYENSSGAKAPLAERWNGTEWAVQSTPSPSGAKWAALAGVSCTSSTACTAVGRYESSSSVEVTLAERWNGTEWTVQSTPNSSGAKSSWLEDVSCSSSTACTAIGRYVNSSSVEVTLAESWNGTTWSVQTTPNPSGAKWSRLADVSCTSSTACLTVGSYESSGSVRMTLAESWNGTTWSIQTTPNPPGSEWNSLKGVWCASATECTAVGGYRTSGEYVTLAERLKGTEWSIQTTPEPKRGSLLDISCASTSWCEATGTNEGKEPLAEHWNDSEWTIEATSIPTGVSVSALEGVSCLTTCAAVGYTETANPAPLSETYPARPPYAKTEPATITSATQATLKGIVNPGGAETTYYFEYGPTTSYGTKTEEVSAGSGMSNLEKTKAISGLTAKTTYHFRIVATNSAGTTNGKDSVLKTPPVFDFAIGSSGSAGGQLKSPTDEAVDSGGNVWVTDTLNNRIEEFNSKGEFVETFGKEVNKTKVEGGGTEAEKNLCTAASGNTCQAGASGSANGQLGEPLGITVTSGGNLWVTEKINERVQEFNTKGEYLSQFNQATSGGLFAEPFGIAIGAEGHIWVAQARYGCIEEFTEKGALIREIVGAERYGSGNGEFFHPTGVATDSKGDVWVADKRNIRVQELNPNGEYLAKFSVTGEPNGIAVESTGNLLVAIGSEVKEFTTGGEFLTKLTEASLSFPQGIAVGPSEVIYVASTNSSKVDKWG